MNEAEHEYPDLFPSDPDRDAAYTILELQQTQCPQFSYTVTFDHGVEQLELSHPGYNEEALEPLTDDFTPWALAPLQDCPSLEAVSGSVTCFSQEPFSHSATHFQEPFSTDPYSTRPARSPSHSEVIQATNGRYMCTHPTCSSSFVRRADVKRHVEALHSENKMPPFPCPIPKCSRVKEFGFQRQDKLTDHLRSVHGEFIPKKNLNLDARRQLEENTIVVHGKVIPTESLTIDTLRQLEEDTTVVQNSTVNSHVEDTYTPGDRLSQLSGRDSSRRQTPRASGFTCNYLNCYPCSHPNCSKTFDGVRDLHRHLKTHKKKDARPHQCGTCGQGFLYPKDRLRHEKTHGDKSEPRYRCSVEECDRNKLRWAFAQRDDLKRHIEVIHPGTDAHAITSSVMLSCIYCDSEFSRRDNLLRHMRKIHPREADHSMTHAMELKPVEESNE